MGWSTSWRRRRARGDGERRRLRVIRIGGPDAVGQPTWAIDDLGSDPDGAHLVEGGLSPAGQRLTMDWVSSTGGWQVGIAGDVSGLLLDSWRGQPVVCEIGYEDHAEGVVWEPVMIGVLDDWQRESLAEERWRLTVLDLVGALQSRMVEGSTRWALFATLAPRRIPAPLASAYGTSDTTIEVNRTATYAETLGFVRETGQAGAVLLRPEADDAFIRTYTGTSTGASGELILTGVSTASTLFRTDQRATSVASTTAAGGIVPAALLTGHPLRIALRILASTGTGENGPDDVYPAAWGYGIPHELIDREDAIGWLSSLHDDSVSDRDQWQLLVTEPQPDGLAWLQGQLSRAGMWLTVRQGRITVRGATAIADPGAPPGPHYGTLSAYDMVEGLSYRMHTGGRSAEAYRLTVLYAYAEALALVDPLRSRPAVETVEVDLLGWLQRGAEAPSDTYPDAELTARRLAPWVLRTCGWLRTRTAHPMAPGLAVGDLITIDVGVTSGRYDPVGLRGRVAMVVTVDPDYDSGVTSVTLVVPGVYDAPTVDDAEAPEDAEASE